ncbi:hypothetical protein SRHO_G00263360 [Serrasalmus rhombeus]
MTTRSSPWVQVTRLAVQLARTVQSSGQRRPAGGRRARRTECIFDNKTSKERQPAAVQPGRGDLVMSHWFPGEGRELSVKLNVVPCSLLRVSQSVSSSVTVRSEHRRTRQPC